MLKEVNLNPKARIVALSEDDPELRGLVKKVAEEIKCKRIFEDYREIIVMDDVDAVVIVTPTSKRPKIIMEAAKSGKHILVDKGVGNSMDEIMRMAEVVKRSRVKFSCNLTVRTNPLYITVKKLIDAGEIGDIVMIHCIRSWSLGKRPKWFYDAEKHPGIIVDLGFHDFDAVRWLTGQEFKEVKAYHGNANVPESKSFTDHALILALTEGGIKVCIDVNWLKPERAPYPGGGRLLVEGTEGLIELNGWENSIQVCSDRAPIGYEWYRPKIASTQLPLIYDFIESILEDKEPTVTLEDAVMTSRAALAARESAQTGKIIVLSGHNPLYRSGCNEFS